jgi:predicted Zn-dependent protease
VSPSTSAPSHELVERALEIAGRTPGHAGTSVIVHEDSTANLRWACNTLTTNGMSTGQTVTVATAVTTDRGVSIGTISRNGVGPDDLEALVADAARAAASAPAAEDAAELPQGRQDADFTAPAEHTGPQVLQGVAGGLGEALQQARSADRELFGFAEHSVRTTWLGTSAGARRRHVQPKGTLEMTGKSHQRSRSTYDCQYTRDFSDVDVLAMDAGLTQRLDWQGRRVELEPGRYDTVLPAGSVADLLIYLYFVSDARSAYEGRTVFSKKGSAGQTRVGERLTDVPLTIASDPGYAGLECQPFVATGSSSPFDSVFDNGMDSPAATWVRDGVLEALPTSRFTSAMTGLDVHPTVDNLVVSSPDGQGGLDDLVASTQRGLLVTSLWYIREVDPMSLLLTGLTRDGVYLVEGGEVQGVVTNFRFNESPVDMLRRIDAVGSTSIALNREWNEFFSRTAVPAMRISDFNMSSTSQGT